MDVVSVFAVVAAIIALGFLSEQIFKRTNVPDVLILLIAGIVIGTVLDWAGPDSFGEPSRLFTTFALVFILFQGALNIEFRTLLNSLIGSVKLTMIGFVLTVVVASAISYLVLRDVALAVLTGMAIGGTSSAVVIPMVKNLNMKKETALVAVLESAITDVLCIVGAITVIEVILTQRVAASGIFQAIVANFSLAILAGVVAGIAWIWMLSTFRSLEKAYMVGVAVVIALYAFVESPWVQASGAIAALAFGLVWGNARPIAQAIERKRAAGKEGYSAKEGSLLVRDVMTDEARTFYAEIGFFVKVFFFVYLGILIDFSNPRVFLYGAILTLAIYLVRPFAVRWVFPKMKGGERVMLEILIPKGLAAAVLAQLAVQSAIPGATEVVNLVLSVVLLSILLTSALAFLVSKGWFPGFWDLLGARKPVKE